MSHFSFIYLLVIATGCKAVTACKLDMMSPAPLFVQNLGSRKIIFKSQQSSLQLDNGETITAYCSSGIMYKKASDRYGYESNSHVLSSNTAEFHCDLENKISIKGVLGAFGTQITVQCTSETNYGIYESERSLPNCVKYVTYAIGAPIQTVGSDIKVGVCYDLDNLKLKFVSFIAQSNGDALVLDESRNPNPLSLDLSRKVRSLKTYFPFMSQGTFNASRDKLCKSQALFDAFEFDFTSLLQDEPLQRQLASHAYIFNTMWWRQLRQHNWRYFLDALRERTRSVQYLVHLGTYGQMTAPARNCTSFQQDVLAVHEDNLAVTAPAYIWAYLQSTPSAAQAQQEDVVVMAYNTPYASHPTHEEFCEFDVCDEIEWLKDSTFGNLRQLPTLGYMFCCRPEHVAPIIDYFPMQQHKTAIVSPGAVTQTPANSSQIMAMPSGQPN